MENPSQNISRGCRLCQQGKWVCIFLTYLCQAQCSFCPSPRKDDFTWTEFGSEIEEVEAVLASGKYWGVGFSGGDCFLVPQRLKEWLGHLASRFPMIYYWAYTNGLAAFPDIMEIISTLGLREIRFNIAATGYDHPEVRRHVEAAVNIIENVAIEIPSIPDHFSQLIKILPHYAGIGVKYLNLHEFILPQAEPSKENANRKKCRFNIIGELAYDADSRTNSQKIIDFCQERNLSIIINDCSIKKKEKQMSYRRINNAERVCFPWERITKEGLLETCCKKDCISQLKKNPENLAPDMFIHPDRAEKKKQWQIIRFMPPMDKYSQRIIVD